MCGIAAIINLSPNADPVSSEDLDRMSYSLRRRGPDGSGIWVNNNKEIGLGSRRLSPQDARPIANQPVWTINRTVGVVLNGEIYNHPELRRDLQSRGCAFQTNSGTEVLASGSQEYGREILNKIQGQFAFIAYHAGNLEKFSEKHIGNIRIGPLNRDNGLASGGILMGSKPHWGREPASKPSGLYPSMLSVSSAFGS